MTDESLMGAWLGLGYLLLCLVLWIPVWLHRHHHEYITTEARELLESGGFKALAFVALLGAVLAVGAYHFFYERGLR